MASGRVQIWPQIDLRMDPQMDPPDWSQTGPQMTLQTLISLASDTYAQNKALFHVLLTIAEVKQLPSRDWIRPPSRCQECLYFLIYYRSLVGYKPR